MSLLNKIFGKNKAQVTETIHHNSADISLDKLQNGELPLGWCSAKSDFIKPRDDKLYAISVAASKATTIDEEIVLLNQLISYYYEYQKECLSLGECYIKYFSDMHMHCHNSKNPDFEFIEPSKARLKYIQENYEKLVNEQNSKLDNEVKKQTLLNEINLSQELEKLIKSQSGILQSDLYKLFDPILKDEISLLLYNWEKSGKISRQKSGRTYQLFLL